jgi:regulatory protein
MPDDELDRVDEVVRSLAEAGLQSDTRCAEMLVHVRIGRGHGPLRIRADLREAGIDSETAELLLEAETDAWPERLRALARKRFGEAPPADRREWAKRARFLASRGFPEALVRDALDEPAA